MRVQRSSHLYLRAIPPVTEYAQGRLFTPTHEGFLGHGNPALVAQDVLEGVVLMVHSRAF